jgi:hypothetical protein
MLHVLPTIHVRKSVPLLRTSKVGAGTEGFYPMCTSCFAKKPKLAKRIIKLVFISLKLPSFLIILIQTSYDSYDASTALIPYSGALWCCYRRA